MSDQNAMLKLLYDNERRLAQTETREVPGNVPGFSQFYDTGTFTPTFAGSGGGGSFTLLAAVGEWTRVGNRVDVWIHLQMNTFTSAPAGDLWVTTLPFTSRNTSGQFYAQAIGYRSNSLATIITALVPANTTRVQFYNTAGALIAASVLSAAAELVIGGSFGV